jgi:hypothetical protein
MPKKSAPTHPQPATPQPQQAAQTGLPKSVMDDLYQVYTLLDKDTRVRLGLMIKIPVFIKDPQVALESPALGVQEIEVQLEAGLDDGPTSARVAVVDYNADMHTLTAPVAWDKEKKWFYVPGSNPVEWLPAAPPEFETDKYIRLSAAEKAKLNDKYREFIQKTVGSMQFHQVNAWAVVQRVLEFYEDPSAMGRPIPWGFDGNRLIVVPHAGYKENAFYDHNSKSLQLYYFGDLIAPGYTCLSHDIITHETGHAVLDGIRPYYIQPSSVQTAAFHEFIGDLTAILVALFNQDLRHFIAESTQGEMGQADVLADLARQFGEEVQGRPYLRSAHNNTTMDKVKDSLKQHFVSQVLTGAMFDILIGITRKHMEKNQPSATDGTSPARSSKVTPKQAFWRAADRLRRVALQPLDLCPPCDIQFLDYARAVLRNDILTNPIDEDGYRQIILDTFHQRGLCGCNYLKTQTVGTDCAFYEVLSDHLWKPKIDMVYHDIGKVARSRTAAYYYLNNNRRALRIPPNQDIIVTDLYDNYKMGAAAVKLPREVILEYVWKEAVVLKDGRGKSFGSLNGKTVFLLCGGTLAFDERGNLLSWFHKPGIEPLGTFTRKSTKKKPTQQEQAEQADLAEGKLRRDALIHYYARMYGLGFISEAPPGGALVDGMKPLVAVEEGGSLRFEQTAHLRDFDFDTEAAGWKVNY